MEVKTLDLVVEEAETDPHLRNSLGEAVVVASSMAEVVAANQSQRPEEVVEGSLAGPLRHHRWVGLAVEEGGCPLQEEVAGSWLAGVAGEGKVLRDSWQPKEVVEGGLGLEVVEEGSQPMVVVGVEVEHFQSPETQVLVGAWEHDRWPGLVIWL